MCYHFIVANKIFCFFKKWTFAFLEEGLFQGEEPSSPKFWGGLLTKAWGRGGRGRSYRFIIFFVGGGGAGKKGLAANVFKFFHDKCPLYMKIVFDESCISQAATRNSTMKISRQLRRTSYGQHCISFLASSVWNNLPNELKLCINLNTCKHKIKKWFLCKIRQKDKDIYLHD